MEMHEGREDADGLVVAPVLRRFEQRLTAKDNMENFSIWHWTILILLPIVYLVPAARILRKAGFSGWLCLLLLVPPINLIMYWVFAFVRWPVEEAIALNRKTT